MFPLQVFRKIETSEIKINMNKKFYKAFAGTLMLASMGAPVFADAANPTVTTSTINHEQRGSITVRKLQEQNGTVVAGTGTINTGEQRKPVEGVKFKVVKVADLEDVINANSTTSTDGAYYTNLADVIKAQIGGSKSEFTADEIQSAVDELNKTEAGINSLKALATASGEQTTDTNGEAVFSNLDLGLYIVVETDTSGAKVDGTGAVVMTPSDPYLVSVPMTNITEIDGHDAGTVWQYDVVTYPKNSTVSVDKTTTDYDTGAQEHVEDWEIGKDYEQTISFNLPVSLDSNPYDKIVVSDAMENMAFSKVVDVYLDDTKLTPDVDYTVSGTAGADNFSVTLTESGLAQANDLTTEGHVYVHFMGYLTSSAEIGSTADNHNQATLTWSNQNNGDSSTTSQEVKVYTYEIDLTKTGLDNAANAVFNVKRSGNFSHEDSSDVNTSDLVKFIKESDGVYRIARDGEAGAVTNISPASDGSLKVKGVDDDCAYTFTEIATESGKNLMADPFTVRVQAGNPENGSLSKATVTIGDAYNESEDSKNVAITTNGAIASLEIKNAPVITLRTGGMGLYWVLGAATIIAAGSFYVRKSNAAKKLG